MLNIIYTPHTLLYSCISENKFSKTSVLCVMLLFAFIAFVCLTSLLE